MSRVLIACERSGVVRRAFRALGHDAWSCDLEPADDGSEFHIQADALTTMHSHLWDLMIAHPPCTRLTNTGVQWLNKRNLWADLDAGAKFFRSFLESDVEHACVENPIPHKYAVDRIGSTYDQLIQPWMFGHMERKATCLWLKNLPPLKPTNNVKTEMLKLPKNVQQRLHYLPPSKDRATLRSVTYEGIAQAMAAQWSPLL